MRRILLLVLLLLVGSGVMRATGAKPREDVRKGEAVLARIEERSHGLQDFTARLRGQLSVPLLPGLPLSGRVFFKRPDHVKVDLDHLPRLVRRYRSNFAGLVPAQRRRSDYQPRFVKEDAVEGKPCDVVALTPRRPGGNLRQIVLWVERSEPIVPRAVARYQDGTTVTTSTRYVRVRGYLLPGATDVSFQMPLLFAEAHATCTDYRLNQNLPDSIFATKKSRTPP